MKAIIQCFNQTYAVQTRRESSLRFFFSQDVQFELFGGKVQKEHLEKRFGGSIFSRRPIWAFWPPKSPKRASWEKVWWLDSWRVLEKILLPSGTKPYFALYILIFQDSPGVEPPNLFSRRSFWTFWRPKSSNWTSWENKRTKLRLLRHGRLESRSGHSRLDCTFFGEFCV